MTDIQILYDGDDITADVEFSSARFTTQAGGMGGLADLRIKDDTHKYAVDYFHAGGTLELVIDSVRQWDGWAINVTREWAFSVEDTTSPSVAPRYWHIEGFDRNFLMQRRFCYDKSDPSNTDFGTYPAGSLDSDVVKDFLSKYVDLDDDGLDLISGITEVGPIDPYEPIKVVQTGQPWADAMRLVGTMNGALSYVDPDRVVRYVDDMTETAPFALSDVPDEGEVGYREMGVRLDAINLFNEAFVRGVGVGNASAVLGHTIDEASVAEHGLLQFAEVYEGMYEQLSVQRRSDTFIYGSPSHLRGHHDDQVRIQCSVFEPGLRVGMGVSFHSAAWDFGDLNYDASDLVTGTFNKNTEFERMLVSIGKIESNNTYTRQNKRSFAYGRWQIMPGNWKVWGPLALGLPQSVGVASRDIDPSNWYPEPTPQNQDIVARWRFSQLYNNKGQDPRRVAASWRSGPGVGSRQPSTWSRGTILYVNHACVPLGYAPVTTSTVLSDVPNPTQDTTDSFQQIQNVDDVYPVRSMTMTFPTPSSVRYDLMLSHEYDVAWSYQDPIPISVPPHDPGQPYAEQIFIPGDPGITGDEPPPGSIVNPFDSRVLKWTISAFRGVHTGTAGSGTGGPSIYSSAGIENGFAANIPWPQANCGGIGGGAWKGVESAEAWYQLPTDHVNVGDDGAGHFVSYSLFELNEFYDLEVSIGSHQVEGYVPGLKLGRSPIAPTAGSYGTATQIGIMESDTPQPVVVRSGPIGSPDFIGTERTAHFTSVVIPAGTLQSGDWLVLSPSWQASGGIYCDPGYSNIYGKDALMSACAFRGPRCSGQGNSGDLSLIGAPSLTIKLVGWPNGLGDQWSDVPSLNQQNDAILGPSITGTSGQPDGIYHTTYPYIAGTLRVTWQGTKLTQTEFQEIEPILGTFKISGGVSGEGYITVTYWPIAGAQPTPSLPGDPGGVGSSQWAEDVITRAWAMIGTPYQVGAESLTATDCSGLVFRCFMDSGHGTLINYERLRASGYAHFFANEGHFTHDLSQARRGDLICYSEGNSITHIAIYLGDGTVISALVNPYGVSHTGINLSAPGGSPLTIYGVCLVPYPEVSVRTSGDQPAGTTTDTESQIGTTDTLPQTPPEPTSARVFRPRALSQYGWQTQYDGVNSMMAAGAMALQRHTLGNYSDISGTPKATPPNIRTQAGLTLMLEGSFADVAHAWSVGWSQTLYQPGIQTFESFMELVRAGRGALLNGFESSLPTAYQAKPYSGMHTVYVNEVLSDGSFLVYDPFRTTGQIVPADALRSFATAIHNGNAVECAFTRQTPEIP